MSKQHRLNLGVASKLLHTFNTRIAQPLATRPIGLSAARYGVYLLLDDYLDQRLLYSNRFVPDAFLNPAWHPKFSDWLERATEPKQVPARWIEEQLGSDLVDLRTRVLNQLNQFVPEPTYEMWELRVDHSGYLLTSLGDYRIYEWHQIKQVPMA